MDGWMDGRLKRSFKTNICKDSVLWKILTGAIEMVHDGVQKGVLWREEALHHRHLGLYGWMHALIGFLSFHGEPGGEGELHCPSNCSTMFWCRQIFLLSIPTPRPPTRTISCSFMKSKSTVSVRKELLSAFSPSASAARVRCHLALACLAPSSPSIQMRAPSLFLCAFISHLSLSLSPPFSLYRSIHPPLHCFYFLDVHCSYRYLQKTPNRVSEGKKEKSLTICWLLRIHFGRSCAIKECCDRKKGWYFF